MKKALISGITGQDGSYLAEFLLQKGYEVHGILRRSSSFNTGRIEHLYFDEWVRDMKQKRTINLHYGDMTDSSSLIRIIQQVQPDEIYNLAAQSHVKVSFDVPEYTAEADAVGTLRMLEAVRILRLEKKTRIYQASTSELFGKVQEVPQKETTPFYPRSPYGVAKQYGFWITKNYRESYGMFAVNGILFNHESERRGETFVTRKISLAAARIAQGEQDKLYLGNLDARRDWGYAKDYVECMWLILQHDVPEDFVIATGEMHTVREFATLAFKEAGIELRWEGEGVNEKGIDVATGKALVEVDPKYFRPSEVEQLLGDPTKAKTLLNWNPRKTSFEELVSIMVRHDMEKVKRMGVAKQYGFWITKNYRESYGMFAVNGILFNHESERRGETFVTRKISLAAARIAQGEQDKLYLGNLDARRDWGYAKDYVECMWLILQHDVPEDFVIATGEMHTVREFATLAFKEAGIELRWEGEGVNEKGIDVATGKALVEVDPKYFRPSEVEQLLGDPTKAKTLLNWNPRKTSFEELVSIMVRHDMEKVKRMIATKH